MSSVRRRVAVLFGGRSGEHPISIRSSRYVVDSLDRQRFDLALIGIDRAGGWHLCSESQYRQLDQEVTGPDLPTVVPVPGSGGCTLIDPRRPGETVAVIDVAFPVLHGPYGEDGALQGTLEMLDVPYVGIGVLGAAVCMDKDVCKRLLRDAGIPVVPFAVVCARDWAAQPAAVLAAVADLGASLFVKPANLGSSLGVSRVTRPAELEPAISRAFALDVKVLVERAIDGREIECAVLGNDVPEASVPGEIIPGDAFYSYEDKYAAASTSQLRIPAPLTDAMRERVRDTAVRAFRALECCGMARVDFFLEKGSETLYLNELNTVPGFTSISMYPKLWAASGLPGTELASRLVELALDRHQQRRRLGTAG